MLSGLQDTGASMFTKLMEGDSYPQPGIEDMERAAEAVRFNKTIKFKSYNVKTFDTSDTKQQKEYAKLMMVLQQGIQASTHVMWYQDRRFVEASKAWLVHLEWAEYELKVEPVAPIGTPEGDTNG